MELTTRNKRMKITKETLKKIIQEELKEVELGRPFEGITLNKYQIALEEEISDLMVRVDLLARRVADLEDKVK